MNKKTLLPLAVPLVAIVAAAFVAQSTKKKEDSSIKPQAPVYNTPISYFDSTTTYYRLADGSQHLTVFQPVGYTLQHGRVTDSMPTDVDSDNNGDGLVDILTRTDIAYSTQFPKSRTNELYGHAELISKKHQGNSSFTLNRTNDYSTNSRLFKEADKRMADCRSKAK